MFSNQTVCSCVRVGFVVDSRNHYTVLRSRHKHAHPFRGSRVFEKSMEAARNFRLENNLCKLWRWSRRIFPKRGQFSHLPYVASIQNGRKSTCQRDIAVHLNPGPLQLRRPCLLIHCGHPFWCSSHLCTYCEMLLRLLGSDVIFFLQNLCVCLRWLC